MFNIELFQIIKLVSSLCVILFMFIFISNCILNNILKFKIFYILNKRIKLNIKYRKSPQNIKRNINLNIKYNIIPI